MDSNSIGLIYKKGTNLLFDILRVKEFIIVTGFSFSGDVETGREKNREILGVIKAAGLTAYSLVGHWESIPGNKVVGENEDCFVIVNPPEIEPEEFFNTGSKILKGAALDAFIYGNSGGIYTVNADGKEAKISPDFTMEQLAQAYRKLRSVANALFNFDGTAQPVNGMSQIVFKSMGLNWFKE